MKEFLKRHDRLTTRLLEILPGFFSWNMILFPYWGVFFIPEIVAYFVLLFNIYWFYQSLQIAITATLSHFRMQATIKYDWMSDVRTFPDWEKVKHVVIIPTYREPIHTLKRTLESLSSQVFPTKQMTIVIAMEAREPKEERDEKIKYLEKKFAKHFDNLFFTIHTLEQGEIIGKSSNERFAALWVKEELIKKRHYPIEYMTVTSCDADHVYHKNHFACITYSFLDNPKRHTLFWQPVVLFYNNIWNLPALTRVTTTFMSIWNLSQLPRKDRLINAQNYTLSFKLLDDAEYWDPDKIPEDWGIFFKAFYKKKGGVEVEPIYLPLLADAVESTSFFKTVKNQYSQLMRWAWGVSDSPWVIKNYILVDEVPFWDKTTRVLTMIWSHFLWPVNWFIITIGLTLPTIINPAFGRTTLGYTVPKISSFILTISLVFLVVMMMLDRFYKPKRPKTFPFWRALFLPLEFLLMPISGFIFGALPGLDAHTRLMLGKYIEYKVTEKV